MFQKYLTSLDLMDQVIAVAKDEPEANLAWDRLFTFVHANFPRPVSAREKSWEKPTEVGNDVELMIEMFVKDRETLETELRKIPPVIAEVAFPVYIARHLLCHHHAAVWPKALTTFDEFYVRYGYMIVTSGERRG